VLKRLGLFGVLAGMVAVAPLRAQQPPQPPAGQPPAGQPPAAGSATICGQQIPAPRALPPANSGPVVYLIAPCFEAQGGSSVIDPETYVYYIQLKASRPSGGGCRDSATETDPRGLPAPVEYELPGQPLD
jgi:hypothetical protein